MANVMVTPDLVSAAATDLATIGSGLEAAHSAAAGPTLGLVPAAADEVSAGIAQLFSREAEEYQKTAGRAAAFHEQFARRLEAGADAFAGAEAANGSSLRLPTIGEITNPLSRIGEAFSYEAVASYYRFADFLLTVSPPLFFLMQSILSITVVSFLLLVLAVQVFIFRDFSMLRGLAALMNGMG
jgi:hypothetical protein